MITIYHNPRCRKSRECNIFLSSSGKDIEVINYMETPFSEEKLKEIIELLKIKPIELVRKNEAIWKEHFKGKKMTDKEVLEAMVKHPKLIERPIVVNGQKAVIARPLEAVHAIL